MASVKLTNSVHSRWPGMGSFAFALSASSALSAPAALGRARRMVGMSHMASRSGAGAAVKQRTWSGSPNAILTITADRRVAPRHLS